MTWGFHPQHLPPMGFLNPSTVCSSEQRACLVSYRHHLWGSKSRNRLTGDHGASWVGQLRRAIPPRSRHAWTTRATEVTRRACHSSAAASGASTVSASLRPYRHVTHQHLCGQRRWEAGPSADQTKAYSIITMHRVSSLAGNTPRRPNRRCRKV